MNYVNGIAYVERCLKRLASEIGARPAGSQANRAAADFVAAEMAEAGFEVAAQEYPCPDWHALSGELTVGGKGVHTVVNTFSPSCHIEAELVPVSSIEELHTLNLAGKIALVHGEITATAFMPKNFDRRYFADEKKDRFMKLLEQSGPAAIITVSHYNIPLPVIEDSELAIPSATVHRDDEEFLVASAGAAARLKIAAEIKAGTGSNLIGRRGNSDKKILICAHYDTMPGTPGAMDNASGIAALLLLARQLNEMAVDETAIELVAFGGEDSWFPGDALYIREFPPDNLVAAINMDGIGMKDSESVIAFFNCPDELATRILKTAKGFGEFVQGSFYESDHGFFWPLGIPTLAFTSMCMELLGKVTHTEYDTIDVLDLSKIVQIAGLVLELTRLFAKVSP